MVEKANYPVRVLCQVMEVSCSGFYAFVKRLQRPEDPFERRLIVKVRAIHEANDEAYGSRRMSKALRADGENAGRCQAGTLMKKAHVEVKQKKRFRVTTDSNHNHPVAPNLLDRQFDVDARNTVWGADIS
jgi:putative transposase